MNVEQSLRKEIEGLQRSIENNENVLLSWINDINRWTHDLISGNTEDRGFIIKIMASQCDRMGLIAE
jgi:hypothetical protein